MHGQTGEKVQMRQSFYRMVGIGQDLLSAYFTELYLVRVPSLLTLRRDNTMKASKQKAETRLQACYCLFGCQNVNNTSYLNTVIL